jgi:mercuric ion transport protein
MDGQPSRDPVRVVELVWDEDCPHVDAARANLREALAQVGQPGAWHEWRRDDPQAPERARRAGSPAILVDGRDVEGHENDGRACCRVYVGADGKRSNAPDVKSIVRALGSAPLSERR